MNRTGIITLLSLSAFLFTASLFSQEQKQDSTQVVIRAIHILGNKATKEHIILRELLFRAGDTLPKSTLSEKLLSAKQNLLNTSLFNAVRIDTVPIATETINLIVLVEERWYTWPIPIFEFQERNFNDWWERRDLRRANYGFSLKQYNFRGRKEVISISAQAGYTVRYGISYNAPYLNRKQTSGLGGSFFFRKNHEIPYMSLDNKQQFFKNPDVFIRKEWVGRLTYTYQKNIRDSHGFEAKYVSTWVDDTIRKITVDYFPDNGGKLQYFTLGYSFTRDFRDSKQYALKGYFWEAEVIKLGLGIMPREQVDIANLFLTIKGYTPFSNRLYGAAGLKAKLSSTTDHPYYIQKGLGWKENIRGYEYYVIDGERYALARAGIKYELIKPHVNNTPLPFSKFNSFHYALYLGLYGDIGYVEDNLYAAANPLANSLLAGYGIGLDYVTYYDLVFRFECSVNKMKEIGFFLHFNAGI